MVVSDNPTPCIACDAVETRPRYRSRGYVYVACDRCGLCRLDPLPAPEAAAGFYDRGYFSGAAPGSYADYAAGEPIHRRNARHRLRLLGKHRPTAGSILDIGCAHGFLLDEARRSGWRTVGVDASAFARRQARERFDLEVHARIADAPGPFDVVSMFQVLEHMADPEIALSEAREVVANDGVLIVETWDHDSRAARILGRRWQQISPPSVVYLFDRTTLRSVLRRAGYRTEWIGATKKYVRAGDVHRLIVEKAPDIAWTDRLLPERWKDAALPYRMGDLITLVATTA